MSARLLVSLSIALLVACSCSTPSPEVMPTDTEKGAVERMIEAHGGLEKWPAIARSLTAATGRRLAYGPSAAKEAGMVSRAPRIQSLAIGGVGLALRLTPHLRLGL